RQDSTASRAKGEVGVQPYAARASAEAATATTYRAIRIKGVAPCSCRKPGLFTRIQRGLNVRARCSARHAAGGCRDGERLISPKIRIQKGEHFMRHRIALAASAVAVLSGSALAAPSLSRADGKDIAKTGVDAKAAFTKIKTLVGAWKSANKHEA